MEDPPRRNKHHHKLTAFWIGSLKKREKNNNIFRERKRKTRTTIKIFLFFFLESLRNFFDYYKTGTWRFSSSYDPFLPCIFGFTASFSIAVIPFPSFSLLFHLHFPFWWKRIYNNNNWRNPRRKFLIFKRNLILGHLGFFMGFGEFKR